MSATPQIAHIKIQITYYRTLKHQVQHRIHRLKIAKPTTKRAQYINYHQIQARRHLLTEYISHLNYYQNYLDLLSGC